MSETSSSRKIEFLLQSYTNTQQAIQFFDTKAGAYLGTNGVMASLLITNIIPSIQQIVKLKDDALRSLLIGLLILGGLFLYSAVQVFIQAFLVLSPAKGVLFVPKGNAIGLFWAEDIKQIVKKNSLEEYVNQIDQLDTKQIVTELAYETAKLAGITSAKLQHLGKATKHFKLVIALWAITLLVISILEVVL